jgi:hypothetical protein
MSHINQQYYTTLLHKDCVHVTNVKYEYTTLTIRNKIQYNSTCKNAIIK